MVSGVCRWSAPTDQARSGRACWLPVSWAGSSGRSSGPSEPATPPDGRWPRVPRGIGADMARDDSRDTMIGAFTAWTVCGLLWFFAFLSALSVGGVVLILAIVLTILL